jgi:hypothetical protein
MFVSYTPPPPPPPPATTTNSTADVLGKEGVTELDAADAVDVPFAFVAVAVNVYAVPAVNPETVIGLEDPVPVAPPGEAVTV